MAGRGRGLRSSLPVKCFCRALTSLVLLEPRAEAAHPHSTPANSPPIVIGNIDEIFFRRLMDWTPICTAALRNTYSCFFGFLNRYLILIVTGCLIWMRLGAGSREPGAGSREPGAGSREPGAGSRAQALRLDPGLLSLLFIFD